MHVDAAACLGKVPTHGDFMRLRASTPTMRAFDNWIRKGLHHARQNRAPDWEETYDEAPTHRFLFWGAGPNTPNVLLGALRPSRDEGGRGYPFMVTCEIPKQALSPHHVAYLPVQADAFYAEAGDLVRRATDGAVPYKEVPKQVRQMEVGISVQPTVPHDHKRYLQHETMGTFLESLFGHFEDNGKYRLFSNLFEALLPLRSHSASRLDYGMEFPLVEEEETLPNVTSFWMDTVLRVLDTPDASPSLFWTDPRSDAASARLRLYVGVPEPQSFLSILASDPSDDRVCVLSCSGARSNAEAALSIPEEYGRLLRNEQLRLWDFLRRL